MNEAGVAEAMLKLRARRAEEIDADLFGEAGWDLLLFLFARRGSATELDRMFSDLHVAPQIGARWLTHLERIGLVERRTDGETVVAISGEGHRRMCSYFEAIREDAEKGFGALSSTS